MLLMRDQARLRRLGELRTDRRGLGARSLVPAFGLGERYVHALVAHRPFVRRKCRHLLLHHLDPGEQPDPVGLQCIEALRRCRNSWVIHCHLRTI